ncbi:MAG: phosphatidylglycerophosphatase A [Acidobacteriota bacterium]
MRRLATFIATSAGAGYSPFASGTAGSLVGVGIYFLTRNWPATWQVALVLLVSLVGIWASGEAARHFDRKDPGEVVIDEVAGQLLTLLLLGVGVGGALLGFVLFRILDIVKPWPARQFESLPSGLGVMADDLMAGAYGWVILFVVLRIFPGTW